MCFACICAIINEVNTLSNIKTSTTDLFSAKETRIVTNDALHFYTMHEHFFVSWND